MHGLDRHAGWSGGAHDVTIRGRRIMAAVGGRCRMMVAMECGGGDPRR
jgi:hypothetical protein